MNTDSIKGMRNALLRQQGQPRSSLARTSDQQMTGCAAVALSGAALIVRQDQLPDKQPGGNILDFDTA
ncbi:MAG: hypothetical protein JO138_00995 [Acidobacteriaceae bacterium]|nr:hypothetical protein [Acidobacteriaceae bacterium]